MSLESKGRPGTWTLALAATATLVACSASGSGGKTTAPAAKTLTIFFTGELKGTIEPCGCTTNPLGDLARTAHLITTSRKNSDALYIDAGSTLYTHAPIPPDLEVQEDLKAELLLAALAHPLNPEAIGLGPYDLARGPASVKPARMAANISATAGIALRPPMIREIAGHKVGIFGVVSPAAMKPFGIEASGAAPAASKAIDELRKQGADLIVGIAHMTKAETRALAKEAAGADILVVGQNLPEPDVTPRGPDRVSDTLIVTPANRGQIVTRLDITLRGSGPLADAIGKARATAEFDAIGIEIEALEASLERWDQDKSADKSFVEQKRAELDAMKATQATLKSTPLQVPDKGPYFVMEQVRIRRGLACDTAVVSQKVAFDKAAGEANLAQAKGKKPAPAPEGTAGYAGSEECGFCHEKELEFWQTTLHAKAWETLVKVGKEYNRDCIYCHVSGWDKPGGSNLAFNDELRDIQCEVCHGPGSLHVEAEKKDKKRTIARTPAEGLCKQCHNPLHSDTFEFKAYLRDVTGEGHAPAFRKQLGDGKTGRELRAAGLEKAGADVGAGCAK